MKMINEQEESQLRDVLVGRRIVDIAKRALVYDTLVLDDGTRIRVVANSGGCSCGAGDYEVVEISTTIGGAIMDVKMEEESDVETGLTTYRIFVYAPYKIGIVTVEGSDGSGYYGTGYELLVYPKGSYETSKY